METPPVKRRLTCILAADAVGYSSHMSADEEGTVKVLAAHRAVIDGIIAFHDGRIVGTAGDSVLAEFSSAVSAVRCASEIQEAIKTRNDALPESQRLLFRVGVNLGDVVVRDHDLLGDGVNIASRLETLAEPGGICISSSVYEQITGKLNLGFLDIGEQTLKNIGRPVRVYRVGGAQPPTLAAVVAPQQRSSLPVATVTLSAVMLAGALAWAQGWLHLGAAPPAAPATTAASGATQAAAPASPAPQGSQTLPAAADNVAPALTPSNPPATPPAAAQGSPLARPVASPTGGGNPLPAAQAPAAKAKPAAPTRPEPAAKGVAPATATSPAAATTAQPAKPDSAAPEPSTVPMPATPASPAPEPAAPRAVAGTDRFDGSWLVRIRCDGGPGGAEPYELAVNATVKQGWLRAERNSDSDVNTLLMEGLIGDDGRATLKAQGQTGDPRYAMHRVRPGSRYGYEVEARFEGSSGTGVRHGRRRCDLQFHRQ